MNKILLSIFAISILVTSKPEKLIIGMWQLSDIVINNIDEYAQSMIKMQMPFIEMQIEQIENQMSKIESDMHTLTDAKLAESKYSELHTLQTQLDEAIKQKQELTVEKVKEEFNIAFNEMKTEFKMKFNSDKTYENMLEGAKGKWEINKIGTILTTTDDSGISNDIEIVDITKEKMILFVSNTTGEMKVEMTMTFTKI